MESLRHHVGSEVPNLVKSDSACSGSTEKETLHLVRIVLGILLYLAQVSYQVAIQLYLVFTYITNASIFVAELKKVRQIIMVLELLVVVVVVVVVVVYMFSW